LAHPIYPVQYFIISANILVDEYVVLELKDIDVAVVNRKVDSGDHNAEDYRVMQSDGYRQRLAEMRQRLGFGCGIDRFTDMISGLPAGELLD